MGKLVVRSYAKINIALNVTGLREDGYHELDMVMLPLKLHDSILISELKGKKDNFVTTDDYSTIIDTHSNIATKAINILVKEYPCLEDIKFNILIHKTIPMQAGMGGGSSNAAATLHGINRFCKLGLSNERILELSKPLGSDVPFFVENIPARCKGKGEIMEPIKVKNNYLVLIVKPEGGCSTKQIYKEFDKAPHFNACNVDNVVKALEEGDDELLAESIGNSLQSAAIKIVPEIQTIINKLKSEGLKIVMMTGSGSAVFAMSTDSKLIKKVARKYEDDYLVEVTGVLK